MGKITSQDLGDDLNSGFWMQRLQVLLSLVLYRKIAKDLWDR
jgi:hypothetical protein